MGSLGVLYAVLGPIMLVQLFALVFIPALLVPGARPLQVGKAIYCYALQALGILLMSLGGLPAFYSVLEKFVLPQDRFSTEMYIALLIVFTCGGLTFLWHESIAQSIEEPSRRVVAGIFWFIIKLVGFLLMLFSAMSFLLTMLLAPASAGSWWILPSLLFAYGLLLAWCTRLPPHKPQSFHSASIATSGSVSAKAKAKKKKA